MRKVIIFLTGIVLCIGCVNAWGRDANTTKSRQPVSQRNETSAQVRTTSQKRTVVQRTPVQTQHNSSRTATIKKVTGRSATQKTTATRTPNQPTRISRVATTNVKTHTFGDNYNSCRDAYFTCMDQFCANQNENYRRCVCSSKLKDIQNMEKLLSQTSGNLQSFEDLNIDAISKTANEVKAMNSATSGESAIKKDKSDSANTLKNISGVLSDTKKQSLSTSGQLDAGGDIKTIWSTTNLIGGSDIANLTGESLFNAVHAQCSEMVASSCASSNLKMVSSAY